MANTRQYDTREILMKAFERIVPSAAYLISSGLGFAASVAVFTTWVLSKVHGKSLSIGEEVNAEEEALVDLSIRIDEKKRRIRVLEEELEKSSDEYTRRMLEKALEAEKSVLESLVEEYELRQLRIMALNKIREYGGEKLYKQVMKLLEDIEKGKRFEDKQLEVMRMLEDMWRKRQLKTNAILQVLSYG